MVLTGTEIKCGMIGFGGLHLIDGHHLDMIDGVIIIGVTVGITMVGIIMDGIVGVGIITMVIGVGEPK